MWLVLLKSAKDSFLGVEIPEQPVPPRVRYGTTCLLTRNAICSESCSVAWGKAQDMTWIHMVHEGPKVRGNLSIPNGTRGQGKS
jgi:hypothetical protein